MARPKTLGRRLQALYRAFIEPRKTDDEDRRRELIFNVIACSLFALVCLLDISVLYADLSGATKSGFGFFTFSVFVSFFGGLIVLSRKGHVELASYLFIGFYFLATTWGEYVWGTAIPLALLSYGAIIVMTSVLLGTKKGLGAAGIIIATVIALGWLETHGEIRSDISWRFSPLRFKDSLEDSFVYALIVVISWLSNREIERSLVRARSSEAALMKERDLLEIKVEERTKELKAAEVERVSQLYRFVEFGRLASGIFHDLVNPLTVISLSVEKLGTDNGTDDLTSDEVRERARNDIEKATRASKRMEAFMQTARKQLDSKSRKRRFSAYEEARDAVELLAHKAAAGRVDVRLESRDDIELFGDPIKFFQIAVNLISNAIDAHERIASSKEERKAAVSLSADGAAVRFEVRDNGCGVPDEIKGSIFEPFFTTKAASDEKDDIHAKRPRRDAGLGLGLSTTKDMVEKEFDGTISLTSREGFGSTFSVIIPIEHATIHNDKDMQNDRRSDKESSAGAFASADRAGNVR